MKTNSFLVAMGLLGLTVTGLHAQVAINNSAASPDASAILDLKSGNAGVNKGFLPQSVALTNVTTAAPVISPATGLIVYSSTAPAGGSGTGYYYWNGTAWASMGGGGGISGSGAAGQVTYWNGASSVAGNNNLFWDNTNSRLGIGTNAPSEPLDINSSNGATTAKFGANSPLCFVANSPMVGFNAYWGGLGSTYYSSGYAGMLQFDQNVAGGFQFVTAPLGTALTAATMTPAMTILNNGYVGIGTATPAYSLNVATSVNGVTAEFDNSYTGGQAIYVNSNGASNWGVYSIGSYEGVLGVSNSANSLGLVGGNNAASGSGIGIGTYGSTAQSGGYGVAGYNFNSTTGAGIGIYGGGSGAANDILALGVNMPGIYGEGANIGVCGYADNVGPVWPVYGANDNGARWAALAYYSGSTDYKVIGSGTVSTIVKDNTNVNRVMSCPEAPEILFEDYGTATLSSGKVHINLDATYAKNVTINEKHPLRVLITLNDQCNGVYVTNRTATGFDVVELNNGNSNASFTYEVIANRADAYDANGTLISKNADIRFPEGPSAFTGTASKGATGNGKNPATPPVVAKTAGVTPTRVITPGSTAASTITQK